MIKERAEDLVPKHIIKDDIFATINYLCCLGNGVGSVDDIDHLGNRRIRSVESCCRTSSASASPAWSALSASA